MTVAPSGALEQHNPQHFTDEPTATFWIQATPGTSYARCVLPARAIGGQALAITPNDVQHRIDGAWFPRQKGPAVWQFPGNPTRGNFIAAMKQREIPCFVEVDDNYLAPNRTAPGTVSAWKAKQKGPEEVASREVHRKIVRELADGVIVSTPHLAKYYGLIHDNVWVCPNCVDPADWPEPDKPDDGVFRIGYAFSTSHYYDFELIWDVLEYAAAQPDVEVVLLGRPFDNKLAFNRFRFVNIPWADSLEAYRYNLQVLDLGLAPIVSNEWSDARSDIKALEYTMVGAATLMSPTESYKPWFDLGDSACFFPERNDPKRWLKEMKWILANRDCVPETIQAAKDYVLSERTLEASAHYWREALDV